MLKRYLNAWDAEIQFVPGSTTHQVTLVRGPCVSEPLGIGAILQDDNGQFIAVGEASGCVHGFHTPSAAAERVLLLWLRASPERRATAHALIDRAAA